MATAIPALSVADWHQSPEYLGCTARQRKFLDAFIETRDAVRSVVAAYGSKSTEAYRRMLADKVLRSSRIVAALDRLEGRSDRDRFIRDLQLTIEHADGIAKIEALKLLGKAAGFIPTIDAGTFASESKAEPEASPLQKFSVGQRVTQRDDDGILHVGEVLAVDAEGHATEIREVHEGR